MGCVSQPKLLLLLSHLSFLLVTSSSSQSLTLPHPPAEPPSHHHPHHLSTAPSPTHPPTKSPTEPPTKTPVHPQPTYPPAKPPVHLPVKPPTKPPTHKPVKPPTEPPTPPPTEPPARSPSPYRPLPRKAVAVEGVVYCKNCTYSGIDTLVAAKPLPGARVVLKCKNTVYTTKKTATADAKGYFFLEAPKTVTSYGSRKCRMYLAGPPRGASCSQLTNLNGGITGAALMLKPQESHAAAAPLPYALFNVGPFAFEPPKHYCLKHY